MKKTPLVFAFMSCLLACVLVLNGCLTMEQTLRVLEDGSILASYVYTYQEANEPVIKAALATAMPAAQMKGSPADFLNENGISEFCRKNEIELRQYRKSSKDGKCTVQIITLVRRNAPEKLFALGGFVQNKKEIKLLLPEIKWPMEIREQVEKLCPDFTLSLTIVAPDKITQTNGKTLRPDTAIWIFTPATGLFAPPQELFVRW